MSLQKFTDALGRKVNFQFQVHTSNLLLLYLDHGPVILHYFGNSALPLKGVVYIFTSFVLFCFVFPVEG